MYVAHISLWVEHNYHRDDDKASLGIKSNLSEPEILCLVLYICHLHYVISCVM
jgi:hypothetical protein